MFLDWLSVHFLVDWFVSCLRVQRYGKEMIQPKLYHDFFKKFFRVALKALKINEKQYEKKIPPVVLLNGYRVTGGERTRVHVYVYVRTCVYVCALFQMGQAGNAKNDLSFRIAHFSFVCVICAVIVNYIGFCLVGKNICVWKEKILRPFFGWLKNFVRRAKGGIVGKINSENLAL